MNTQTQNNETAPTAQITETLEIAIENAIRNILLGERIPLDIVNARTGEILIPANRRITLTLIRKMVKVNQDLEIDPSPIRRKVLEVIDEVYNKYGYVKESGYWIKPQAEVKPKGSSLGLFVAAVTATNEELEMYYKGVKDDNLVVTSRIQISRRYRQLRDEGNMSYGEAWQLAKQEWIGTVFAVAIASAMTGENHMEKLGKSEG
jgi:hypothetical protein